MNRYLIVDYIENVLYSVNDIAINDDNFCSSVSCMGILGTYKKIIDTINDDINVCFKNDKIKYLVALYNLKKAFKTLNEFTQDATIGDFNEILDNKNYPFNKDFNELTIKVIEWVNDNIDRLEI